MVDLTFPPPPDDEHLPTLTAEQAGDLLQRAMEAEVRVTASRK